MTFFESPKTVNYLEMKQKTWIHGKILKKYHIMVSHQPWCGWGKKLVYIEALGHITYWKIKKKTKNNNFYAFISGYEPFDNFLTSLSTKEDHRNQIDFNRNLQPLNATIFHGILSCQSASKSNRHLQYKIDLKKNQTHL